MGDHASDAGQNPVGIEFVEGAEQRVRGSRKLQDDDPPAGAQHPGQFAQPGIQIAEIAHAEGDGGHVDRRRRHIEVLGIAAVQHDAAVQTAGLDLAAGHVEHALREVDTQDVGLPDAAGHGDGQVTRSGAHVEDAAGFRTAHDLHDMTAPETVDAHRERMVEQVVLRRDVVEHLADLLLLGLIGIVGFHS